MTVRAQDVEAHHAAAAPPYGSTAEVPDRLTFPATLVLVAVALAVAFGGAVLVGGDGSRTKPATVRAPAPDQPAPGSAIGPDLTAAPAVPALRVAREANAQLQRSTGVTRSAAPRALTVVPPPAAPAASPRPTPTAAPRQVAPTPPRVVAPPKPTAEPTPAATPEGSGDFDTTGETATEVPDQSQTGNSTSGVAK